jgi:hypothetical protein
VHSQASASRERSGPYFAEYLYEISVENRDPPEARGLLPSKPARNNAIINRILSEKVEKGELTPDQVKTIIQKSKI